MPIPGLLAATSSDLHPLAPGAYLGSHHRNTAISGRRPASVFLRICPHPFHFQGRTLAGAPRRSSFVVSQRLGGDAPGSGGGDEDFITRVLKENPTQVEPKFLVGDRFVTLREKVGPGKDSSFRAMDVVKRLLGESPGGKVGDEVRGDKEGAVARPVYLKDLLREFRGKLYVPEEVFRENLSEEEEFEKNLRELPVMIYDDFQKHLKAGKIKLLTSKSSPGSSDIAYRDFIVELKEIPGQSD